MAAPIWIILLPLVVLGGFAAIVALVVFAIVKNRPWIVAAIGGGLFLLLVAWLLALVVVPSTANVAGTQWNVGPVGMSQSIDDGSSSRQMSWHVSLSGLVLVIAIPLLLLFGLGRSLAAKNHDGQRCGGIGRKVVVLALIFGFFGLFALKWHAVRKIEQVVRANEEVVRAQMAVQRSAAEMSANVRQQVAETDIHAMMDKFDQPKITIPQMPTPPSPPAAPSVVAVAEIGGGKTEAPDPVLEAEAKAAVTAIVEKDESTGEVASAAGKSGKSKQPETAAASTNSEKSTDEKSAKNHTKKAAPVASPAAEATSPAKAASAPRPSWVTDPPKRVGDTRREVFVTDEWSTDEECDRARDIGLMLRTYEEIQRLIGAPYQGYPLDHTMNSENSWGDFRLQRLAAMGITLDYVRQEVAKDEYLETVERSFGPMKKLYTQIEFTPSVDRDLRQRWEESERNGRLEAVGFGAGGILGLLGFVYGLLKVDTWTKGYYSKRLFIGVPAAIIGLVALLAFMVK